MDFMMQQAWAFALSPLCRTAGLFFAAMMLSSALAIAQDSQARPLQFKSVNEMIEDRNDFSEEKGSFKLVSAKPLHIQLAPTIVSGERPENMERELRRAALYGIYRSFVHTKADAVVVTVIPQEVTFNPISSRLLKSPSVQVRVTRAQAMKAANQLVKVTTAADLIAPEAAGDIQMDEWTPEFRALYFEDEGQLKLLKAIKAAGGDLVNNG